MKFQLECLFVFRNPLNSEPQESCQCSQLTWKKSVCGSCVTWRQRVIVATEPRQSPFLGFVTGTNVQAVSGQTM